MRDRVVGSDRINSSSRDGPLSGTDVPTVVPDIIEEPSTRAKGILVRPFRRGGDLDWRADARGIHRGPITASREPAAGLGTMTDKDADALWIDDRQKLVFVGGQRMRLSCKEFGLLCLLASDPGRVFSAAEILDALWPDRARASRADVRQSVYQLRQRIETDPTDPRWVVTVKGFGYRLAV